MNDHRPSLDPSARRLVFQTRRRSELRDARLLLESVGIATQQTHSNGEWTLTVADQDEAASFEELAAYQRDNAETKAPPPQRTVTFGGAFTGVLLYGFAIGLLAFYEHMRAFDLPWRVLGRMKASEVTDGQLWRVFTALTLHVDGIHLMSNLLFGGVFGWLTGRLLGGGVGWLVIVIAGGLGNLLNALVRDPDHASIGASTAVFAALGVLVAHALRPRLPVQESAMRRWSPLVGGVLLLSLFGLGGERTDVVAHATGFLSGLLIGWAGCRVPESLLHKLSTQVLAGALAAGLILVAWIFAIESLT